MDGFGARWSGGGDRGRSSSLGMLGLDGVGGVDVGGDMAGRLCRLVTCCLWLWVLMVSSEALLRFVFGTLYVFWGGRWWLTGSDYC